jgi:molybdenum cofactor cytidylyltransferase
MEGMIQMTKRRPAVVVLAAGRGMRFRGAGHKLEQSLGDETVLARTVGHAIATGMRVVVVTTAALEPSVKRMVAAREVVLVPELNARGQPNPLGMGFSIAAGVSATGDADGWLIVPGDMPMLRASSMVAVAQALEQYPVAYAQYRGQRGHPVGFSAELYSELVGLQGDEGARRLVARYPAQAVDLDDPGVLLDVDTDEDLARVRAHAAGQPTGAS